MSKTEALAQIPEFRRQHIEALAAKTPRVADLAETFPLLLLMLAVSPDTEARREQVLKLVEAGRPLSAIARTAGIPLCLRRIHPSQCYDKLPWIVWSADASKVLANELKLVPREHQASWLRFVFFGAEVCDEAFAIWIAHHYPRHADVLAINPHVILPLAIYAWHSAPARSAHAWMAFTPWSGCMALETALVECRYFLNRMKLLAYFEEEPLPPRWSNGGSEGRYEVVPLNSFWQLMEERVDMRNCLDCYADKLAANNSRIFGIRKDGKKIATLELGPSRVSPHVPSIVQLKGPGNADVPLHIWHMAFRWLAKVRETSMFRVSHHRMTEEWIDGRMAHVLGPYFEGRPQAREVWKKWSVQRIDAVLCDLAAKLSVHGWPFRLT